MNKDLEAIRAAWDPGDPETKNVKAKRDAGAVLKLADKYVSAHKADFAGWENLSQELLVRLVEESRDRGDEESEWKAQTWLFHRFEPQNVGGPFEAKVRLTNG